MTKIVGISGEFTFDCEGIVNFNGVSESTNEHGVKVETMKAKQLKSKDDNGKWCTQLYTSAECIKRAAFPTFAGLKAAEYKAYGHVFTHHPDGWSNGYCLLSKGEGVGESNRVNRAAFVLERAEEDVSGKTSAIMWDVFRTGPHPKPESDSTPRDMPWSRDDASKWTSTSKFYFNLEVSQFKKCDKKCAGKEAAYLGDMLEALGVSRNLNLGSFDFTGGVRVNKVSEAMEQLLKKHTVVRPDSRRHYGVLLSTEQQLALCKYAIDSVRTLKIVKISGTMECTGVRITVKFSDGCELEYSSPSEFVKDATEKGYDIESCYDAVEGLQ